MYWDIEIYTKTFAIWWNGWQIHFWCEQLPNELEVCLLFWECHFCFKKWVKPPEKNCNNSFAIQFVDNSILCYSKITFQSLFDYLCAQCIFILAFVKLILSFFKPWLSSRNWLKNLCPKMGKQSTSWLLVWDHQIWRHKHQWILPRPVLLHLCQSSQKMYVLCSINRNELHGNGCLSPTL